MTAQNWTEVTVNSLQGLWVSVINFLPSLIGALVILIIGLIVAAIIKAIVQKVIDAIKVDTLLKRVGLAPYFERGGLQINAGKFVGLLVYWFLVIVFVLAAADILQLWGLSAFLQSVVFYLPNIIVAVLIMLAAVVLANFLRSLVRASVSSARLHGSKFLGSLTWWVVIIFGFLAALIQLGIATVIINTLVTGLIAMLALAGGIAFGLGGKDYASHLLGKLKDSVE
jgi:hypothetical protein